MKIETKYNIGAKVIVLRRVYDTNECECCGKHGATTVTTKEDTAIIKRIEIESRSDIVYLVRFTNGNGGAMTSYGEDEIIGRAK